ncbi:hypothetical protein D6764_00460 [Candidatus Woesearchaeota archaeon]|nr:MAG: hypothetical protein D6764_00460 [Candidatus Woesearchaeota archaeon]
MRRNNGYLDLFPFYDYFKSENEEDVDRFEKIIAHNTGILQEWYDKDTSSLDGLFEKEEAPSLSVLERDVSGLLASLAGLEGAVSTNIDEYLDAAYKVAGRLVYYESLRDETAKPARAVAGFLEPLFGALRESPEKIKEYMETFFDSYFKKSTESILAKLWEGIKKIEPPDKDWAPFAEERFLPLVRQQIPEILAGDLTGNEIGLYSVLLTTRVPNRWIVGKDGKYPFVPEHLFVLASAEYLANNPDYEGSNLEKWVSEIFFEHRGEIRTDFLKNFTDILSRGEFMLGNPFEERADGRLVKEAYRFALKKVAERDKPILPPEIAELIGRVQRVNIMQTWEDTDFETLRFYHSILHLLNSVASDKEFSDFEHLKIYRQKSPDELFFKAYVPSDISDVYSTKAEFLLKKARGVTRYMQDEILNYRNLIRELYRDVVRNNRNPWEVANSVYALSTRLLLEPSFEEVPDNSPFAKPEADELYRRLSDIASRRTRSGKLPVAAMKACDIFGIPYNKPAKD